MISCLTLSLNLQVHLPLPSTHTNVIHPSVSPKVTRNPPPFHLLFQLTHSKQVCLSFIQPRERPIIGCEKEKIMGQAESSTEDYDKQQQQHQQKQLIPGLPDEIAMDCLVRVPHQFHSNMKLVCRSWRTLITHPSFYKERRRSGTAEQMVCLIQPLPIPIPSPPQNETESSKKTPSPPQYGLSIYNASHQTWHRIMGPNANTGHIPMFCQCVPLPAFGKLMLLGGWDPKSLEPVTDVYVLDFIGGFKWKRAASMSVARSFFACGVVGDSMVYVAGGHDNQKNALQSAEVYDVNADEWRVLPPMAEERDECQGLTWEGDSRFWVLSGYSTEAQGLFRSDAECYDPKTGSWSIIEGVWPFPNVSPRGLTTTITISNQNQLWCFLGGQQFKQSRDNNEILWNVLKSVQLPDDINVTSLCVTAIGQGQNQCCINNHPQQQQRIFVMSSSGGRGVLSSSNCGECECEGKGAYMLEREIKSKGGSIYKWNHVHTPVAFASFPYSASYIFI